MSVALLLALAAAGPLEATIEAALEGPDSRAIRIDIDGEGATIGIEVPVHVDLADLPPSVENRYELAVGAIAAARPNVDAIHLLVAHPGQPLKPPPVRRRPDAPARPRERQAVRRDPMRYPFGQALTGYVVAMSAGHGWIQDGASYRTQRGNLKWNGCGSCRGIVEDFETHEIVTRYIVPLLEGAGARVILVRERGYSTTSSIATSAAETGLFADGTSAGGWGGDYRVSDAVDARATFSFAAPSTGQHHLALWFVSGANRHDAARLEVTAGGTTHAFLVDMRTHGRRWTPITDLFLAEGDPISIVLEPPVMPMPGEFLIADAARVGSGTHASGHPMWQMAAKSFAAYQDAPASVQSRGDVTIRPAYAEFFGADAYVSFHSNASGAADSTAAGTATYRYNCGAYPDHSNDPPANDCDDPTGSDRLQRLVHDHLVASVRESWDTNWRDRGTKVANFGEMRELDGIPGTLVEVAFHDNVRLPDGSSLRMTDNQALHDPRFRRAAAFGVYRGISEFLAEGAPVLAPPPTRLYLRRVDATTLEVSFDGSPDAMAHRLYVAIDDRVFDEGRIVSTNPALIEDLPPESIVAVRLAALNAAGEGRPSRIVSARPSARPAQVLLVDAFEREDAWVQDLDNRWDTLLTHGLAMADAAHAFDGATQDALDVRSFEGYDGVVLALGRESTADEILTADLRTALSTAAVFAAGSEIAWALDERGDDEMRAFLRDVFGARFGADDAGAVAIQPAAGGWMEGAPAMMPLADAAVGLLETQYSDVLLPEPGAAVELTYEGTGEACAVRNADNVAMGVALDSVVGAAARAAILSAWATEAIPLAPPDGPPVDGGVNPPDAGPPNRDGGVVDVRDGGGPAGDPDGGTPRGFTAVSEPPIRGGCGCNATPDRGPRWPALLLMLLLVRRRRA